MANFGLLEVKGYRSMIIKCFGEWEKRAEQKGVKGEE
jgi:hypothetical protein